MPKRVKPININLVPRDPFYETAIGRVLRWALSAGRYIIIFTELIVIISFAARFTLDRQLTDLNSDIERKKSVIMSYGTLESDVRTIQSKITDYTELEQTKNMTDVFEQLSAVTPRSVTLDKLTINPESINIEASAPSQSVFNIFITNLQISPLFQSITIGKIESANKNAPGFTFTLTARTQAPKKLVPVKK